MDIRAKVVEVLKHADKKFTDNYIGGALDGKCHTQEEAQANLEAMPVRKRLIELLDHGTIGEVVSYLLTEFVEVAEINPKQRAALHQGLRRLMES